LIINRGIFPLFIYLLYSILLHLPPLIFTVSEYAGIEGSGAVQTITNPDGPKTYGSYVSGTPISKLQIWYVDSIPGDYGTDRKPTLKL
jgi:hypothetical protein